MAQNGHAPETNGHQHSMSRDEAWTLLNTVHAKDPKRTVVSKFNELGDLYEVLFGALNYGGPQSTAVVVASVLKDNYDARFLDAAAGTGLVGDGLFKMGYKNMDALDPAEDLLEQARSRGIYTNLFSQCLGKERVPVEDGTYDMVALCGAITHIPLAGYPELLRVVKKGGHFINSYLSVPEDDQSCTGKFESFMQTMETEGVIRLVSRVVYPDYLDSDSGVSMIYQKL